METGSVSVGIERSLSSLAVLRTATDLYRKQVVNLWAIVALVAVPVQAALPFPSKRRCG